MSNGSEAEWEDLALEVMAEQGWKPVEADDINPGAERGRESWDELAIRPRLLEALRSLNPDVPGEYLVQAVGELLSPRSQDPLTENQRLHQAMVEGYRGISYLDRDGVEHTPTIRLVGTLPEENEWLVTHQVTLRDREHSRRLDVVCYLNGMPVAIVELKKAGSAHADIAGAHAQIGTYLREFGMAFRFALCCVISDGITARYGTPFTSLHHYSPWNVDDDGRPIAPGESPDDPGRVGVELEHLLHGVFNTERFGQLLRDFTAFDADDGGLVKRIAKPHQYFAVTKAVGTTVDAVRSDGRAGVVWHTQGSGKSMEMELYAHRIARHPELKNPTIVVITDRKELDGQLFEAFDRSLLLPESPIAVRTRSQLRDELSNRASGGIYFTTLQKFGRSQSERDTGEDHPLLSDRRNIVVIVDEAHRSHYDDLDGYARHLADALPGATLIAFTGTPISEADRDTQQVFGDYIDIYDLTRAVTDGATVPVRFEARLAKVGLAEHVTEEQIDEAADEATAGLDEVERGRVEKAVAVINAVYGAPARLERLAADIVGHWEQRREEMTKFLSDADGVRHGKAMIVCSTRDICARLYEQITELRPDWHDEALERGRIKVIYSGSATDTEPVSRHVRRESENKTLKKRFKDVDDELELVIVKDMMLTGYDAPPLHTLYLDRPLKGALLMQTLARVNRTFRGKQDGLLVAYAPLAEKLGTALAEYTTTDQEQRPVGRDIDEEITLTRELLRQLDEVCSGFDWRSLLGKEKGWLRAVQGMTNHLRNPQSSGNQVDEGEATLGDRFRKLANHLARAWALCAGSDTLDELRTDAQFYEEVRVWMGKYDAAERQASGQPIPEEIERVLRQVVDSSTDSGEVVDIYAAAGIERPTLSELTPEYAAQAQQAPQPHLAIEALRALLTEESGRVSKHNLVRQRAFSERLTELMNRYTNSQLTSAEVIAELIEMAREVAAEGDRGQHFDPPLGEDELAFYDAVSTNESAVELQGEDVLAQIARELVSVMRRDVKTDWTVRDDVRAKLRSQVKRLLVKHKYPPDKQPEAIRLVIDQMEAMAPRYADVA